MDKKKLLGVHRIKFIFVLFQWVAPAHDGKSPDDEEEIGIDLGEEYEQALHDASQEEIIDLAAILGFHSMMNQDQYHASLLNKGQPVGLGWDGITKASQQKVFPNEGPNQTNIEDSIKRVKDDDQKLIELNLNNIKVRRRLTRRGQRMVD